MSDSNLDEDLTPRERQESLALFLVAVSLSFATLDSLPPQERTTKNSLRILRGHVRNIQLEESGPVSLGAEAFYKLIVRHVRRARENQSRIPPHSIQ